MQKTEFRSQVWNHRVVKRLATGLARLAAKELIRTGGPVRDPDCLGKIRALLRREITPDKIVPVVSDFADASLHLSHPRFAAQQVAAPIPVAALVESVVAALNNSLAVWEMSPAGTAIDRGLFTRFKRLFGYPQQAEGSVVAGGGFANLTALLAARARFFPGAWKRGGARLAVLAGAQTHYSVSRAAGILGLGSDAVFTIPLDSLYRTDAHQAPAVFRAARRAGFHKFVLVATCGSTPTGSCDNLVELGKIARAEGAWFHVDAAHGGGLAFSRRYRHYLRGIERADSIAFDPHKMLFMPLAAGAVLVRDGRNLRNAFEQNAPYLFGVKKREFPDIAPFTIACSQRVDALKTWLTWKAYSNALWEELTTRVCEVAHAAYDYCVRSRVLEPVHEPQTNILCFRVRQEPRRRKGSDALHLQIKEAVNASGRAYISSTVLDGRRCLRIVVMNPRTRASDIVQVVKEVERAVSGLR
ncbi:MAG: aspartate aminotransferase family protein [Terriglobia bacterium]